ncbi:D,D-heptose 7-phosphate kinase [hydrothermal vent metagenome]|uniref:D,D-heptose 7-phosphate kinase n=1 Tax=hydrothermal vent metagenome TaxID=652676 RepID=A0A3B1CWE8_9ZZZZ
MIRSSAPTRIDLAGGTLDIWPLHLFFDNPPTLNAAIDLYATVELKPRRDKRIRVHSKDLNLRAEFSSLSAFPERHPLNLILKTVQFYAPKKGLELTTECQAPAGSGIGGSSALNIALHGALHAFTSRGQVLSSARKNKLIEISRNIETQIIAVPAGWQDYFPAMHGGVLAVKPGLSGVDFTRIPLDLKELTHRFVLCYTGKPRQSGINNWDVTKRTVDGDKKTIGQLKKIQQAAREMEVILGSQSLNKMAPVFQAEWQARKALAPGISTSEMDNLIRSVTGKGALAAKVCGAGGGGCVAFIVKKNSKSRVQEELRKQGGQVLDFRFVKRGLRVQRF